MVSLFTSVRMLRLKQYEYNHSTDVDCVKITNKYYCTQGQYIDAKNKYFHSQCSKCENQSRLQKNVQYVDKLFRSYKCLYMSWDLNQPLILFFSNGAIVSIELNCENNTLLKVDIDENLCGKFLASRIVDIVVCKNYIYVSYFEPKFTIIQLNHESPRLLAKVFGKKKGKVVGFDPKFFNFDLCVHSPKPAERKLSMNKQKDLLLVWWKTSGDDVWPWMPITYLTDRLNLFVYSVNGTAFEFLFPVKVQNELLHASFSCEHSYKFFCLEESKKDSEIITNVCIYEIVDGHCQIVHSAKLPVNGRLIAFDWSSTEDKLLASDSNGLLIIYDVKSQYSTVDVYNLKYLPLHISWHPQACIALIVCRNNQIFCVDVALNLIDFKLCYKTKSQSEAVDISSFFSTKFTVQKVMWQKSAYNDTCLFFLDPDMSSFLLLKLSLGYITRNNITSLELISQYLKCSELDRAKLIYLKLEWEFNSDIKFQCLSKIINYLLRRPLSYEVQGALEYLLGSFYRWIDNIPRKVIKNYEPRMYHLTRRFFHRLLRYNKFKKAWSLAVDLDSQDLFLDLYQIAKQKNENILAAIALRKAEEYDSSVTDTGSESCQSNSSSESTSSSYIEHHNRKVEKWTTYRKMYQDVIDRISDSYDLESYDEKSKKIDEAFAALNYKPDQRLDINHSYSLKQENCATENLVDIRSINAMSLPTPQFVFKSSSQLSLQHLAFNTHSEFSDFNRGLKYATTPLSSKDHSNILHHKSSQESSFVPQESEIAHTSLKTVSKCETISSAATPTIVHHNWTDSASYKDVKSPTQELHKFNALSLDNQCNPQKVQPDKKQLCYHSSKHKNISIKNLCSTSSSNIPSLPTQLYDAECESNLSLGHPLHNKNFNFYDSRDSKHVNSLLSNSGHNDILFQKSSKNVSHEIQEPSICTSLRTVTGRSHNKSKSRFTTGTLSDDSSEFSASISSDHYRTNNCNDLPTQHSIFLQTSDPKSISEYSFSFGNKEIHSEYKHPGTSQVISAVLKGAGNVGALVRPVPVNYYQNSSSSKDNSRALFTSSSKSTTSPSYFHNTKNSYSCPLHQLQFKKDCKYCKINRDQKHISLTWIKDEQENVLHPKVPLTDLEKTEIACTTSSISPGQTYKQYSLSSVQPHDTKYSQSSLVLPTTSAKLPIYSDSYDSSSKVCDIQHTSKLKINDSYITEEESEEVEGTKIKLAHLGII